VRANQIALLSVILLFLVTGAACVQPPAPASTSLSALQPTRVVVRILALDMAPSPTLPPTATPPPTPTVAPTRTPLPQPTLKPGEPAAAAAASPTPACTNLAEFVRSLSASDNTAFEPGVSFAKLWRVKNIGTCTWSPDYQLIFAGGEAMSGAPSNPLDQTVNPGDTADLRVNLVAPTTSQTYTGYWMLQEPLGATFGTGPDGSQPLTVIIFAKPTPKATPG
jgi:hypothetical protein